MRCFTCLLFAFSISASILYAAGPDGQQSSAPEKHEPGILEQNVGSAGRDSAVASPSPQTALAGYNPVWLFSAGLTTDNFKAAGLSDLPPEQRARIYDNLKRQRFTLHCGATPSSQNIDSFDRIWVKIESANGVPGTYKAKLRELLSSVTEIELVEQSGNADLIVDSQVDANRMGSSRLQQVIVMSILQPCVYGLPGGDPAHLQNVRSFIAIRLIAGNSLKEMAHAVDTTLNTSAFPFVREQHKREVDLIKKIASAESSLRATPSTAPTTSSGKDAPLNEAQAKSLHDLFESNQPLFHCGKARSPAATSDLSVRLNILPTSDRLLSNFLTQLRGSIGDLRSFEIAPEGQDPDYSLEIVSTYWTRQNSILFSPAPSAYTVAMDVAEPCEFRDPVIPTRNTKLSNAVLTLVESRDSEKDTARKIAEKFQKELLELRQKPAKHN